MSPHLPQALAQATKIRTTAHFEIRYARREPEEGGPTLSYGVHRETLVDAYAEGLEAAWADLQKMAAPVAHPKIAPPGLIRCLVTDLYEVFPAEPLPMCYGELKEGDIHPLIVLPVSFPELVDWDSVLATALSTARHEPAHAWAFRVWRERWPHLTADDASSGIRRLSSGQARWLLEGHAVAVEAGLSSQGFWLQHAWSWCEHPEISLLEEPYTAGFFARYLDRRLGLAPGEVFSRAISAIATPPTNSDQALTAVWQALNQVVQPHLATAEIAWLESCRAGAYIAASQASEDIETAVFSRYGRRSVTAGFSLDVGEKAKTEDYPTAALSCRYFSLTLDPAVTALRVNALPIAERGKAGIRAGLWSTTDATVGAWLPPGQSTWPVPAAATAEPRKPTRWFLICAAVPDAAGRVYESDSRRWSVELEAL